MDAAGGLDAAAQLRLLEAEIAAVEAQMLQLEQDRRQRDLSQVQEERRGRSIRRMSAVQSKHAERLSQAREHAFHDSGPTSWDEGHYQEDDEPTSASYYDEVIEEIIEEEILEEPAGARTTAADDEYISHAESALSLPQRGALFAELAARTAGRSLAASPSAPADTEQIPSSSNRSGPSSAGRGGLLGDMMAAVGQRQQRVESGSMVQRDVKPTARLPASAPTKPSGFDLAAMVASAAVDREARLSKGGEKRMKKVVIKECEEYRQDFKNVAIEAAELGRLTRLNEHVVEAVVAEKGVKKDSWESKGLMAIEWRTSHMAIIHEAAALGNQTKMREYVIANYDEDEDDEFFVDEATQFKRMQALTKAEGASKVEHCVALQKLIDAEDATRNIVRPMYMYNDITNVVLPKGRLPKIDHTKAQESIRQMARPLTEISNDVIQKAIERMQRLKDEDAQPRMRVECNCGYCETASPFQTFAYRVVEGRVKGVHIPKELKREMVAGEGKRYKVRGKGGKTRVTRAIKADETGEIDKDKHFYLKMKERDAQLERKRNEKAKPRVKRGRVSRMVSATSPPQDMFGATPVACTEPVAAKDPPASRVSSKPPISQREQLEAEIRAMEQEIERQRLQTQIKQAEAAIALQKGLQDHISAPVDQLREYSPPSSPSQAPTPSLIPSLLLMPQVLPANDTPSATAGKKKGNLMGRMFSRRDKK